MDVIACLTLVTAWGSRDFVRIRTSDRRVYCGQVAEFDVRSNDEALEGELVLVASGIGSQRLSLGALKSVSILGHGQTSAPDGR